MGEIGTPRQASNSGFNSVSEDSSAAGNSVVYESNSAMALRAGSVRVAAPKRRDISRFTTCRFSYRSLSCANPEESSAPFRSCANSSRANRNIQTLRYTVSASLAKGRWNRAIGRSRSVQGQPEVAMIKPSTELRACCAEVSACTVRSACVTVTPTVSNETSSLSNSTAGAMCSADGQCVCCSLLKGQLAHWLNFNSVQNGGSAGSSLV